MPVEFEEYDPEETNLRLEEGSNAHEILSFLLENPDEGYTPKEIHEATDVPRGSVGTTLARLKENGLVRHKEPYWAVERDDRLAAYEGAVLSLKAAEERFPTEDEDEWLENAVDPR
ncbi:MAG: helix-turn-helix domain-containing protein [Halobacteriales archaeon]|nr:helix-turn-helix domain-containing protein [Halobacteriales archaeon]